MASLRNAIPERKREQENHDQQATSTTISKLVKKKGLFLR
jgi:hypothetical protein